MTGHLSNSAAMKTMFIMYLNILDIGCFSHTLDLMGSKIHLSVLDKFMKHWEGIFKNSFESKLLWREQDERPILSY